MRRSIAEKLEAFINKWSVSWIVFLFLATACAYNDIPRKKDCSKTTFKIGSIKITDESSCLIKNGQAEVLATGGSEPYFYSTNNLPEQRSNIFEQLSAGSYAMTVRDVDGCLDTTTFKVANFASKLSAVAFTTMDNLCFGGNGSVKIRPLNGVQPYKFSMQNQLSTTDSIFLNLNHGQYTLSVLDALQCEYRLSVTIPKGNTGVSWLSSVKSIISSACSKSGCHVSGTNRVDLTKFENVKLYSGEIRARVISRSMPFDSRLPDDQIQLLVCWVEDGAMEN